MDVISTAPGTSLALAELAEDAKRFSRAAKARATIGAYASDIADFERFCALYGLAALLAAPQTVGRYVSALAITGPAISRLRRDRDGAMMVDIRPAAVSTIRRRLVAIAQQYRLLGHASPIENAIVREILKGIARERACRSPSMADSRSASTSTETPRNEAPTRSWLARCKCFARNQTRCAIFATECRQLHRRWLGRWP